jgi:hypothetical protein
VGNWCLTVAAFVGAGTSAILPSPFRNGSAFGKGWRSPIRGRPVLGAAHKHWVPHVPADELFGIADWRSPNRQAMHAESHEISSAVMDGTAGPEVCETTRGHTRFAGRARRSDEKLGCKRFPRILANLKAGTGGRARRGTAADRIQDRIPPTFLRLARLPSQLAAYRQISPSSNGDVRIDSLVKTQAARSYSRPTPWRSRTSGNPSPLSDGAEGHG